MIPDDVAELLDQVCEAMRHPDTAELKRQRTRLRERVAETCAEPEFGPQLARTLLRSRLRRLRGAS